MFCKWCGGRLAPSDSKCKRCGREVPALSDCGGFYDLVPDAKQPAGTPCPCELPLDRGTKPEVKRRKSGKSVAEKLSVFLFVGAVVVFAFFCVVTSQKINQCTEKISELEDEINRMAASDNAFEAIEARLEALEKNQKAKEPEEVKESEKTKEPEEPESNEAHSSVSETDEHAISRQKLSFSCRIVEQQDPNDSHKIFDLSDCKGKVVVSVTNEDKKVPEVYSVEKFGEIKLDLSYDSETEPPEVSVSYEIDEAIFGRLKAPDTYKWKYRAGDRDNWNPVLGEEGHSKKLSISEDKWQDMISDSKEELELRCEICRANTDGGSVTFVIEGICFHQGSNADISQND